MPIYVNSQTGEVRELPFKPIGEGWELGPSNLQTAAMSAAQTFLAKQTTALVPVTGAPAAEVSQNGGFNWLDILKWVGPGANLLQYGKNIGLLGGGAAVGGAGISGGTLATGAAIAGAAYLGAQAIGTQFPWETGPGEGFIAPWSRAIVKDESGKWVTAATRPDLFGKGNPTEGTLPAGVTKVWEAGGSTFFRTVDGKIHTTRKDGTPVSYRPYRSIVIGKKLTTSNVKRVSKRIKSHVKSLRTVLSILK